MCKKQTAVSDSSTESEIIFSDAGLRLDGIPALDFCDLIVTVLHGNTHQNHDRTESTVVNNSEVCLEKSYLHRFLSTSIRNGIRRLHPVHHSGSAMTTGGTHIFFDLLSSQIVHS